MPNGSLKDLLWNEKQQSADNKWNSTKKYITLLGISSAMKYLHKHQIIFRNLKPENVLFDSNYFPHISGLETTNFVDEIQMEATTDNLNYIAPEIIADADYYTQKADVYSFAMIAYEIVTGMAPFQNIGKITPFNLMEKIASGYRPNLDLIVNEKMRNLISLCWSIVEDDRPSFDEIFSELKKDFSYFGEDIDKSEIEEYLTMLEKDDSSVLESLIQSDKFDFSDIFTKKKLISRGDFGEVFKLIGQKSSQSFVAKVFYVRFDDYSEQDKIKAMIDLIVNFQLNHSSISKTIKISPFGFQGENHPVIFSEFQENVSLFDLIENQNAGKKIDGWNNTKKCINIYGIAHGMAYLHSQNILHFNLTTKNILEDENFYPKINNCCISHNFQSLQSMAKMIENSPFISPEFYLKNEYTKMSEVYSFGMIVFSLITNQYPYSNNTQIEVLVNTIEGNHPKTAAGMPKFYSDLINDCLSLNPDERPTFTDIVKRLENEKKFIPSNVDMNEYNNYIKHTNAYQTNDDVLQSFDESDIKSFIRKNRVEKELNTEIAQLHKGVTKKWGKGKDDDDDGKKRAGEGKDDDDGKKRAGEGKDDDDGKKRAGEGKDDDDDDGADFKNKENDGNMKRKRNERKDEEEEEEEEEEEKDIEEEDINEEEEEEAEEEEEHVNDEDDISYPFLPNINTFSLKSLIQLKLIGEGGFARIYKVKRRETNVRYAAKVAKTDKIQVLQDHPIGIEFEREIKCHSQLNHKAIS